MEPLGLISTRGIEKGWWDEEFARKWIELKWAQREDKMCEEMAKSMGVDTSVFKREYHSMVKNFVGASGLLAWHHRLITVDQIIRFYRNHDIGFISFFVWCCEPAPYGFFILKDKLISLEELIKSPLERNANIMNILVSENGVEALHSGVITLEDAVKNSRDEFKALIEFGLRVVRNVKESFATDLKGEIKSLQEKCAHLQKQNNNLCEKLHDVREENENLREELADANNTIDVWRDNGYDFDY